MEPRVSSHLQDIETETQEQRERALSGWGELRLQAKTGFSRLPAPAGTSGRLRATSSPRPPGQPLAGKPTSRGLQASSTPGTTNHRPTASPPHHRASAAGGPSLRLGCGGLGRRRVPAETPGLARRSHALRPGPCLLRPWGGGLGGRGRHCYHGNSAGGGGMRGAHRGGASGGPGARAGGRGRAQGAAGPAIRSFLGIFRHFSVSGSPTTAAPEPRSRPPVPLTIL